MVHSRTSVKAINDMPGSYSTILWAYNNPSVAWCSSLSWNNVRVLSVVIGAILIGFRALVERINNVGYRLVILIWQLKRVTGCTVENGPLSELAFHVVGSPTFTLSSIYIICYCILREYSFLSRQAKRYIVIVSNFYWPRANIHNSSNHGQCYEY